MRQLIILLARFLSVVQLQTESCILKISPLLLMTARYEVICFEKTQPEILMILVTLDG
jgi:hypothetical protein